MGVPLLDLRAQYVPLRDELIAALTRVCDTQRFIGGPEIDALEREIAAQIGVSHAIAVSSGTDALLAAMMALGIGPGDEVVTSTFSFFATAGCIVRLGATPRLVDIDPATYNIAAANLERAITPRTRAIIPVHLYGLCADMTAIMDIARRADVPVIEDAAQALGATCNGHNAGTFGSMVVSPSFRARISARSGTVALWSRRTQRSPVSCGYCEITAPNRSTSISALAATFAWMRYRRRFCE
jgi:dTDP-4-amino-4,6-dideoxygalactose transaminase